MANQSLVASITELIPEITLDVAHIYQNSAIGPGLVNFQEVSGQKGIVIEFPEFTAITASASPAEGTEPTAHTLNLTIPSGTLAKRTVFVQLSGLAIKGAGNAVTSKIGEAMGMAKAKADDVSIFNIVTGTTEWTTGTGQTNGALTITNVLAGLLLIQQNEVSERINFVTDANGYNGIRTALTPVASDDTVAGALSDAIQREALVSRAFGMDHYVTERISSGTVTATTEVTNSLIFVKSGIGYGHAWSPAASGLEVQRQANTDVFDMILNYYDTAIVANAKGVCKVYHT